MSVHKFSMIIHEVGYDYYITDAGFVVELGDIVVEVPEDGDYVMEYVKEDGEHSVYRLRISNGDEPERKTIVKGFEVRKK